MELKPLFTDLPYAVPGHECIDSMCVRLLTNTGSLPTCKLLEASQSPLL